MFSASCACNGGFFNGRAGADRAAAVLLRVIYSFGAASCAPSCTRWPAASKCIRGSGGNRRELGRALVPAQRGGDRTAQRVRLQDRAAGAPRPAGQRHRHRRFSEEVVHVWAKHHHPGERRPLPLPVRSMPLMRMLGRCGAAADAGRGRGLLLHPRLGPRRRVEINKRCAPSELLVFAAGRCCLYFIDQSILTNP